jgi:hypothetical protein
MQCLTYMGEHIVTNTSVYCGFLTIEDLLTLQFYNYLQSVGMDPPYRSNTHKLLVILDSTESTISTAVPSPCS